MYASHSISKKTSDLDPSQYLDNFGISLTTNTTHTACKISNHLRWPIFVYDGISLGREFCITGLSEEVITVVR